MNTTDFSKRIIADDFTRSFDDPAELFGFVKELSENDEWITSHTDDMDCVVVPDLPLLNVNHSFGELIGLEVPIEGDPEAIEDTGRRTKLASIITREVDSRKKPFCYLLSETGVATLALRTGITAPGPAKVYINNRSEYKDILNTCCKYQHKKLKLLLRGEKIRAVNSSAGGNGYAVLDEYELLDCIQNNLDDNFPGNQMEKGHWSHERLHVEWSLPDQQEALLKDYAAALNERCPGIDLDGLMPIVVFYTSDTADTAAAVMTRLRNGKLGSSLSVGPAMRVIHKNNRTVKDFEEETSVLFSRFIQRIEDLTLLLNIPINYPENALRNAMQAGKFTSGHINSAAKALEGTYAPGDCTAHDIYVAMNEVLYSLEISDIRKADDYAECVARYLHWDEKAWKAMDVDYLINGSAR